MDPARMSFIEQCELEAHRKREERIDKNKDLKWGDSLKEAAKAPFSAASEMGEGSGAVQGHVAGFALGTVFGVGDIAATGLSRLWVRRPAKLPRFKTPLDCVSCGKTHPVVIFRGEARDAESGHLVEAIRCRWCKGKHHLPKNLTDRTLLSCSAKSGLDIARTATPAISVRL